MTYDAFQNAENISPQRTQSYAEEKQEITFGGFHSGVFAFFGMLPTVTEIEGLYRFRNNISRIYTTLAIRIYARSAI